MSKLISVKCFYSNGETISTNVNGQCSDEEIKDYFVGKYFDLGIYPAENMRMCLKVEITR